MKIKGRRSNWRKMLAACLAATLAVSSLCLVGCSKKNKESGKGFVTSRTDTSGVSYAFVDGELKELGKLGQVLVTPDRSHYVVLNETEFCVYGKALSDPQYIYGAESEGDWDVIDISANGAWVTCVRPGGESGTEAFLYRVYFDGCSLTPVEGYGEWMDYEIASGTMSIAYADSDGDIFILRDGKKSPVRIANITEGAENVNIVALSENGESLVWCEDKGGNRCIRGWLDGSVTEICSYQTDDTNFSGDVYYTKDAKLAVVCDYDEDSTYICQAGAAAVKVKLEAEDVITAGGDIALADSSDAVKGLYLLVEEDDVKSLYFVGVNGERERVTDGIKRVEACNGRFFYIDSKNTLWCAVADGGKTLEGHQVSEKAVSLSVSEDGGYLYYISDYADSKGALGRYDVSKGVSEKVDESVYGAAYFEISRDGKTVFYYKNVSNVKGVSFSRMGELYVSVVGKAAEKVASDAVVGTLDSGNGELFSGKGSVIDPKSLSFLRYDDAVDGNVVASWMLYDGSGLRLLADSIVCE